MSLEEFDPIVRQNTPVYLIELVKNHLQKAEEYKNSTSIIYACLEARNILEWLDMHTILLSVDEIEHDKIINESKPKNAIRKVGKSVLKERYQVFFQLVCELGDLRSLFGQQTNVKAYDFKESFRLQGELAPYIHSYWMKGRDVVNDSPVMIRARQIVDQVMLFLNNQLIRDGNYYHTIGIIVKDIPAEDYRLLQVWKNSNGNNVAFQALKEGLIANGNLN